MSLNLSLAPTTALEAVNNMLLSIGQGAVHSLESSEGVDAQNARLCLHNASRAVQSRGWFFNRDYGYTLVADVQGEIALPAGALEFTPQDTRSCIERGRKLYNRDEQSYKFPAGTTVCGTMTWLLDYEELPQVAREYIHRRAGREFQVGAVGSDLLYRFTREMEDEALADLHRADLRADRPNIIEDDLHAQSVSGLYRRR